MTKSRSPFLTAAPGLKLTWSRNPVTRARSSTASYASVVPVYSRYRVTGFWMGCATVTSGGWGGTNALTFCLHPPANAIKAQAIAAAPRRRRCSALGEWAQRAGRLIAMWGSLSTAHRLGKEPRPALRLVHPDLDHTRGGDVPVLVADPVRRRKRARQVLVVGAQLHQHVA